MIEGESRNEELRRAWEVAEWVYDSPVSDFYRKKFQAAGVDPHARGDFSRLPFSEKREFVNNLGAIYDPPAIEAVQISSGSTGSSPLIVYRNAKGIASYCKKVMFESAKRVAIIFPPTSGGPGGLYLSLLGTMPDTHAVLISPRDPKETAAMLSTFQPDALYTASPFLLPCLPSLPKEVAAGIRLAICTTQLLSRLAKEEIQKYLPQTSIRVPYGSAEAGLVGYQCEFLAKRKEGELCHPARENVYVEIVEDSPGGPPRRDEPRLLDGPPNGRASLTDESGEIVISYTWKAPQPFIRYRTGDAAQWVPGPCPCGEPLAFKILGRVNFDWVKIGGLLLHTQELERALAIASGGAVREFQAILAEEKTGNALSVSMRILVLLAPPAALRPDVADTLARNLFVSASATWSDCVGRGRCRPITIEAVDALAFPGKPQRVLLSSAE